MEVNAIQSNRVSELKKPEVVGENKRYVQALSRG